MSLNKLLPLVLSAKRKSWRMMDSHADESDKRYLSVRPSILERDRHTCRFCEFRAAKYQHVHHLDDDHGNNDPKNLVTACVFCHQCFHLGLAGIQRSGVVIWCPEIRQADLNNICRAIFVAVASGSEHEGVARHLYTQLESRASDLEAEVGTGASNPLYIGQGFIEMSPEDYATRHKRLNGLRLLPRMNAFGKEIAYWQSDPAIFGSLSASDWAKVLPDDLAQEFSAASA